ncbi:hypothetical protein LC612_27435 [Nostoc sp. CHAB 5834]|nr:hypothetical protein [Nostoc sp. CHAB 5834]
MAEQLRENPGDDFLMECWADDPASADCDQKTISEVNSSSIILKIVTIRQKIYIDNSGIIFLYLAAIF